MIPPTSPTTGIAIFSLCWVAIPLGWSSLVASPFAFTLGRSSVAVGLLASIGPLTGVRAATTTISVATASPPSSPRSSVSAAILLGSLASVGCPSTIVLHQQAPGGDVSHSVHPHLLTLPPCCWNAFGFSPSKVGLSWPVDASVVDLPSVPRVSVVVVLGPEVLSCGAKACWGGLDCGTVDTNEDGTPEVDECEVQSGITLLDEICWGSLLKITAASKKVTFSLRVIAIKSIFCTTLRADFRLVHEGEHLFSVGKTTTHHSQSREGW